VITSALLITVLTFIYSSQGLPQEQAVQKAAIASGSFVAQVVLSVLQLGFMLWIVRWLVTKVEKQPFDLSKLGLVSADRSKFILFGIALAVGLSLLTIGFGIIAGTLAYLDYGVDLFGMTPVVITLLLAAGLAIVSGFSEELAFRGYLQTRIAHRYNSWVAVILVAILFAFAHPLSNAINPLLYRVTSIMVGVLFGTIFALSGSLWMVIALHSVWNYAQIAVLAVRNSVDERFFGSPLFVFDNLSGAPQMLIELGVIALSLVFVF
jgi:membrane protease YdiL (CAAX protease family)